MTKIIATGVPVKYPELGEIRVTVIGDERDIVTVMFESMRDGVYFENKHIKTLFDEDMTSGPSYPLCAEPFSMRCALFILFEWFGEAESCWVEEPKHVILEGEIEPMESVPGRIY